jgi:hypothetical protein
MKTLCFDLDNTICNTLSKDYRKSTPKYKVIKFINTLYIDYEILIFTARYMGREKGNISKAKKRGYKFTEKQLKKWGLRYDKLIFGKPTYDILVDDKNLGFEKNWIPLLKTKLKKNKL